MDFASSLRLPAFWAACGHSGRPSAVALGLPATSCAAGVRALGKSLDALLTALSCCYCIRYVA